MVQPADRGIIEIGLLGRFTGGAIGRSRLLVVLHDRLDNYVGNATKMVAMTVETGVTGFRLDVTLGTDRFFQRAEV